MAGASEGRPPGWQLAGNGEVVRAHDRRAAAVLRQTGSPVPMQDDDKMSERTE